MNMSYLVLARKWRPQTFDEVVGQEHVTRTLRNAITSGRVAHAFLFTGPRGVGKTTTARLLAKALNCENGPTAEPCNTCSNCTEITAGTALDVLEIDGASHTGVDNIRDLTEGIQYRPVKSRFRVVIIDEVHMLSNAAFNALLKTLEEPPLHVKFIFATTESHKILATISSRCQRYDFKRIPLRELIAKLRSIAEREGLTVDDRGLALLAREADGSLRDAESLLDQVVAWSNGEINERTVQESLGVADRQALFRLVEDVLGQDPASALRLAGDLYQHGYDPRRLCHDLLEHFRNLVFVKVNPELAALADLPDHEIAEVQQQASRRSLEDLQRLFTLTLRAEEDVSKTAYAQLVVEMTLVKLASQPAVLPIDEALARLETVAQSLSGQPLSARPASQLHSPAAQPAVSMAPLRPPAPLPKDEVPALRPAVNPRREDPPPSRPRPSPMQQEEDSPRVEEATAVNADQQQAWDKFLAAVQKEKISVFFALKSGRLLDITQTSLRIGLEKDPYFKELSRKENVAFLETAAKRAFGRPLTVEVTKGGATSSPSPPSPVPHGGQAATPQSQPGTDDSLVKTVLDVLGGEVQKTRSHRVSNEPSQ
ncbi:MAG: DNA polymerase III subunit gamma/tau [Deltaproteobacteria bacterium]|nr:DNA polymerase III subunit gamma/tau [Deltaproteobacteria bacterium]